MTFGRNSVMMMIHIKKQHDYKRKKEKEKKRKSSVCLSPRHYNDTYPIKVHVYLANYFVKGKGKEVP